MRFNLKLFIYMYFYFNLYTSKYVSIRGLPNAINRLLLKSIKWIFVANGHVWQIKISLFQCHWYKYMYVTDHEWFEL